MEKKNPGSEKALQKIRQYCAYQERCHQEVKEKLYGMGLYKTQVESLISQLIEENFLNEERFALAFAGGKFRINHWGRVKIKYALRQKKVSEYCIRAALSQIDEAEYVATLAKLGKAKFTSLKADKNSYTARQKVQAYLVQKGYESNLVSDFIHK